MSASKIAVEGVSKQFDQAGNPVQALAKLNLAVSEGEFVSIVGPSGCGKSTLLYMLGGFIAADSGRMLVDGRPITGPGIAAWCSRNTRCFHGSRSSTTSRMGCGKAA
jgi:NitT/TauT family transport system ATP-binding protein